MIKLGDKLKWIPFDFPDQWKNCYVEDYLANVEEHKYPNNCTSKYGFYILRKSLIGNWHGWYFVFYHAGLGGNPYGWHVYTDNVSSFQEFLGFSQNRKTIEKRAQHHADQIMTIQKLKDYRVD